MGYCGDLSRSFLNVTQEPSSIMQSKFIDIDNAIGLPLPRALMGLLKKALSRDHSISISYGRDPVKGRRERMQEEGTKVGVELYGDGSGLEVALAGRWLLLGVETRIRSRVGSALAQ